MPVSKSLSKSLYVRGLKCEKALWLDKHKADVLTPPDASAKAIFATGNEVGELACDLFPGGNRIAYEGSSEAENIQLTKKWVEAGGETIYEATFSYNDVLVKVDIFRNLGDGKVEIYEVKSSTKPKDTHIDDASIQHYVLEGLGYKVSGTYIVHINNQYVRGDALDVDQFLTIADISDEIKAKLADIPKKIEAFRQTLSSETEPEIPIGPHCNKPNTCDAKDYCWHRQGQIPEYSIFNLTGIRAEKSFPLFHEGIITINDIIDPSGFSSAQQIQIAAEQTKEESINREAIKQFLDGLSYPIYHLDFETIHPAVPRWKNTSPNQQIPFQYSIHIEYEDGKKDHKVIHHKEYLDASGDDPRYGLAKRLVEDIPKDATVLAYNMGFEKARIKSLAQSYSDLAPHLMNIHGNIQDLMAPFQNKDYYKAEMKGKYTIKKVLPALVPELARAYEELDTVHKGDEATLAYDLIVSTDDEELARKLKDGLLEYCGLDTYAMVKVLEKLKAVVG
ncbi:DUF2779 domain-containing protein [Pseudomonadota bacterium]